MRSVMRFFVSRRIPFLRKWLPSLYRRWAEATWTGGYCISKAHNLYFITDHCNLVDRTIAFYGDWEPQQNKRLRKFLREKDCDVFIDIGANFGFYSLVMAKTTNVARIIAFEPDIRNVHHFHGNLYLNGLSKKIELHQLAVSDINGTLMFKEASLEALGGSRVLESQESASEREAITVEAIRLGLDGR